MPPTLPDRLESIEIVPALRAGFVVLTDRYTYSLIARAMVRGLDPAWMRNIHRFALKRDARSFTSRIGVLDGSSARRLPREGSRLLGSGNRSVFDRRHVRGVSGATRAL